MFISIKMQTKLRTYEIVPNTNISFPIGTILAVEDLYNILNLPSVFSKHKKYGIDINKLLKALVSYKLTDNFSIKKAHQWINRDEVLEFLTLIYSVKELPIEFLKQLVQIRMRSFCKFVATSN